MNTKQDWQPLDDSGGSVGIMSVRHNIHHYAIFIMTKISKSVVLFLGNVISIDLPVVFIIWLSKQACTLLEIKFSNAHI
jgi:hypothetical protein